MNAPDRYEKFVVPDTEKKIVFQKDTRVQNAATFTIQREDHTLGNLIRMQLHRDPEVTFAGYKIPHPLEYRLLIKVQTRGRKEPKDVMITALTDVGDEVGDFRQKFEEELRLKQNLPYGT